MSCTIDDIRADATDLAREIVHEEARLHALEEARAEMAWDGQRGERWTEAAFDARQRELFGIFVEDLFADEYEHQLNRLMRAR